MLKFINKLLKKEKVLSKSDEPIIKSTFDKLKQDTILQYIALGIQYEKIHYTSLPNTYWSFTKKKVVETLNEQYDLIKDGDNYRLTNENIALICTHVYAEIDEFLVTKINNSEGIIISSQTYNRHRYRFCFIPKKEECIELKKEKENTEFIPENSYEFFNIIT